MKDCLRERERDRERERERERESWNRGWSRACVRESRDAAAGLAISHLLLPADRECFRQIKMAKDCFACCSTPSSTTLGCLILPFLFPHLHAFSTVLTSLPTCARLTLATFPPIFEGCVPPKLSTPATSAAVAVLRWREVALVAASGGQRQRRSGRRSGGGGGASTSPCVPLS
ncbi:unnamed protein product [Closterium sp. NIES-54]